jgi:hypothetical protein
MSAALTSILGVNHHNRPGAVDDRLSRLSK